MALQQYYVQPIEAGNDGADGVSGQSIEAQGPLEAAELVLGTVLAISGQADQMLANVLWLSEDFQTRSMPIFKLAAAD